MTSTTFSIRDDSLGISALVTLTEYFDANGILRGTLVNMSLDNLLFGSLGAAFFDIVNDDVAGLAIASTLPDGSQLNAVTAFSFGDDTVNKVGSTSIKGSSLDGGFDVGVEFNPTISGTTSTATFFVQGASLADFSGQEFAVRLKSNDGLGGNQTGRLVGIVANNAIIGDKVFEDLDADGIQDAGESGVAGVRVNLLNASGVLLQSATTNAQGEYFFLAPAGTYQVEYVAPTGFGLSPANQGGNDALDSDASSITGRTGLITLAANETNLTVDAGLYRTVSPSNLTVKWLGFDFNSDVGNEVIDARVFDLDGDGDFLNADGTDELAPFLVPKVGGTFTQRFSITNTGGAGTASFKMQEGSSIFVDLINVTGSGVTFDPQTDRVTIANMAAGQTIELTATSKIVNGDGTLREAKVTFGLADNPNTIYDFGNATGQITQYWSATGFKTTSGQTTYRFNEFAPSRLEIDLNGDAIADARSDKLTLLRSDGTLTEGRGGLEPGTVHKMFSLALDGDVDARTLSSTSTRSIIAEGSLSLVWTAPPGLDLTTFAGQSADGTLSGSLTAYQELLRLTNQDGIFSEAYGVPTTISGNNTYVSTYDGKRYNRDGSILASFSQQAIPGKIVESPQNPQPAITTVTYSGAPPTFQEFVNGLNPALTYKIIVNTTGPVEFFNYSADDPNLANIATIQLTGGATLLTADNKTRSETLDLSQTLIITASGVTGGVNLTGDRGNNVQPDQLIGSPGGDILKGSNGIDTIIGGGGNDTLVGGNSADTFIFANGTFNGLKLTFGNDIITDFDIRGGKDAIRIARAGLTATIPSLDRNNDGRINGTDASPFVRVANSSLILDFSTVGGGSITIQGMTSINAGAVTFV